jgi:hypothetical protein
MTEFKSEDEYYQNVQQMGELIGAGIFGKAYKIIENNVHRVAKVFFY